MIFEIPLAERFVPSVTKDEDPELYKLLDYYQTYKRLYENYIKNNYGKDLQTNKGDENKSTK